MPPGRPVVCNGMPAIDNRPRTPFTSARRLRQLLPADVVAVALPESALVYVRKAVESRIALHAVSTPDDAAAIVERCTHLAIIIPVPSAENTELLRGLLWLRARYPNVPTVALFFASTSSPQSVLKLGGGGITEIASAEPRILADDLLASLARAHAEGVTTRLWEQAALDIPDPLVTVLRTAIRLAHEPLTNFRLAAGAGMHERTLRKYCEHERLPSPQWIIGWARLLVASFYLDDPGRTLGSVAEMLKYPSACALRNQLRRYTGLAPSVLRTRGITALVSRRLEQAALERATSNRDLATSASTQRDFAANEH